MKRRYSESSSTSVGSPQSRPRPNPQDDSRINPRVVADHYSARPNQTWEEREASPIIHLKKLNNWIKSVLIKLYTRRGDAVLDLGCGKGGDLGKWGKAGIGYYFGADIAQGSIEDCRTRYNGDADRHQRDKEYTFPACLLCADCFEVPLDENLVDEPPLIFVVASEARARRALANVSALLRPGGTLTNARCEPEGLSFGNSVYWIHFDEEFSEKKFKSSRPFGIKYMFNLEDAVDCPEWVVPFHVFKSLAEESDMELVFVKNAHEFVHEYMEMPEYVELMRTFGALGDGKQDQSKLSQDEWEVAYLYLSFVFRKRGQPQRLEGNVGRDKGKMHILKTDIMHIGH